MPLLSRSHAFFLTSVLAVSVVVAADKPEPPLPLQSARQLKFDVNEGTWMSLDVAPDGRALVFELLGDVYRLDASGGTARLLMGGMSFDSQPQYSPDGNKLAFISDRSGSENLWIANADGSQAKALSKDEDDRTFTSPAWSPDGQYVYVTRSIPSYGIFEIWMYHVSGGTGVQITKANGDGAAGGAQRLMHQEDDRAQPVDVRPNTVGPEPSPDGRYLYYSRKLGGFEYNAELPMWSIARRDLASGTEDVIVTAPGSAMRPELSRDGTLLAYATRYRGQTGLRLRNLNSGEDRWLKWPVQRDEQEATTSRDLMPLYDFTPDGRELIVSFGGKIQRLDVSSGAVREIPFTANVQLDVGPQLRTKQKIGTGPVRARIIQAPRQSPDGQRVAFSALGALYIADLTNTHAPRKLTATGASEFHPVWSPDGRYIAYVNWDSSGGHIWRTRADGVGEPQRLTDTPGYYSDPVFSRDGATVFALRSSRDDRVRAVEEISLKRVADLIRIPAQGGSATLVSHAQGARSLHLTSDSQRIHFYSDAGLQSVRLDGSDRRVHVNVKGLGQRVFPEPVAAHDVRLSPDGKWALAQFSSHLHLLAVPQTGDEKLEINLNAPMVPHKRITKTGADYFNWADDGRTITWSLGSKFYRLPLTKVRFDDTAAELTPEVLDALVELPRDMPNGTLVLRGGTAITMRGDEVIPNADIVITNNRIVAIGSTGSVKVPEGAQVRDVSGRFITPGFIDTHAHWYEIRRGVLDLSNWSFLATLAYGVTSGLDVQPFTSDMFVYEDMIDAGLMVGPRAFSTGPGMFSDNRITNRQSALDLLMRYRDFYGTRNLKSYAIGSRRERQFIVSASRELGMLPTTEGALDFKLGLTHAIDGFAGHEHALPNVPLYDDVVQLFARTGISYTIANMAAYGGPFAKDYFFIRNDVSNDPKVKRFMPHALTDMRARRQVWFSEENQIFPQLAEGAAKIMRAGGRIGVGSHGEFQGLGYHWELESLAAGGLKPHEVLRAATIMGADILGRADELGSIEPGKFADLVVLTRNPLEDVRHSTSIESIVKNGRVYDGNTLDEQWPRQRTLPALWFHEDQPVGSTQK